MSSGHELAGYSGTPLPRKLGIKPDHRVALIDASAGFKSVLEPLPEGVKVVNAARPELDVILLFVVRRDELERHLPNLIPALTVAGGLWVAWPKQSSGVATDINKWDVRAIGLATGLVDNKICAVTDVWSGVRFVRRLSDR
jgi:hypothetical protein